MACIWYVSKYVAPPGRTGAGGRGYLIMRELARMGHRCVIITSDSNQLTEPPDLTMPYLLQQVDGLDLWWVRTLRYRRAKSARRILSWLHFEWRLWCMPKADMPRPDAVIVSSLSLLTILNGLWLRWRHGCRLVFEIRDIWPLTITEEGGFSPMNPLVLGLGLVEKLGYSQADAIVGTMPNLSAHVAEVLGQPKSAHCIPMGVDDVALSEPEDVPLDYVQRYLPEGKFIVAHAGTIGITNALDTLLDAAQACVDLESVHFVVAGDGDLRAHYQARYAHLPNLTFAPRVTKRQVQAVLSHCDLLYFSVHPSKVWRFGQSLNKVVDYMLAGKPIVASYTGFPSMINEADCGTFVPAGDVPALAAEVKRYAGMSQTQREIIGRRGRDWILEHRQYPTLAREYLALLEPLTEDAE